MNAITTKLLKTQFVSRLQNTGTSNMVRRYLEVYSPNKVSQFLTRNTRESPWKQYNDAYKLIFIHIPRTAGSSIFSGIIRSLPHGHTPLYVYNAFDRKKTKQYLKVAVVRNPWDRLVSSFHYLRWSATQPRDLRWSQANLYRFTNFQQFLKELGSNIFTKRLLSYDHFRPQCEFIEVSGWLEVDILMKYERLESDVQIFAKRIGVSCVLPHINASNRGKYRKYYDDRTKDIVAELYKRDVLTFGYDF